VTPPIPKVTPRNRPSFVSSRDVPDGMAEAVARVAHHRGCGSFDGGSGNRLHNAPPFEGSHRRQDVVWASVHIADLCNALKVAPKELLDLAKEDTA
jgi:hypothetical protein